MLHSTQTTKKHTGNLILRFGMAGLLAAGLFFSAPYSAAAETVPSAENTDAGEITIHFTHYDAQDLEFYLNTDQAALAFTDATLTFQDSTMDAPVTMSYLSDDGSYVLYQNSEPVEEVNGTFSVSMVTEPGYTLDMDQISFYVNGQAVSNGGSVVITDSSAAMTSLVYCTAIPETPATDPEPSLPKEPSAPEVPEEPAAPEPSVPEQPSAPAETPTVVQPSASEQPAQENILPETAAPASKAAPEQVPASEPIAAEPIASAVVTEDEEVDLSRAGFTLTAQDIHQFQAVTLCVQLVHFDLVNAVVDCADIFVVRCRNDTADMRAEVTLCHTAKALVEHAVHQTSEAAVLMGMYNGYFSVMIACHEQVSSGFVHRQIAAAHAVNVYFVDRGQVSVILHCKHCNAFICNRIQVFAV